jgi:8-oxo-dGTP diphosphatase
MSHLTMEKPVSDDRTDRLYPARPLVGVGAVVWDNGRVLLERRGKPPAQGTWSLPGGLIEIGETAEDAVRREVVEECGIEVTVGPVLGLFEPIHRDQDGRVRYHFVVVDFLARYHSGELRAGDDAAELRWARPAELDLFALNPATRAMIDRALAQLTADDREPHRSYDTNAAT